MSRGLLCCVGLVLALAPVAAFADNTSQHRQAELANAEAQLALAQQQATDLATQSAQSAANERTIAVHKSEVLRQAQLDDAANAAALQQLAQALADAVRNQGDANAANELAILQIRANALTSRADASLTNALAIGRADEIANAQAQAAAAHQLADYLTTTLAQENMANDETIADNAETAIDDSASAEAQNDVALGANDVLAADTVLSDAEVAAESAELGGDTRADTLLSHAEDSLVNAEAMAAEGP